MNIRKDKILAFLRETLTHIFVLYPLSCALGVILFIAAVHISVQISGSVSMPSVNIVGMFFVMFIFSIFLAFPPYVICIAFIKLILRTNSPYWYCALGAVMPFLVLYWLANNGSYNIDIVSIDMGRVFKLLPLFIIGSSCGLFYWWMEKTKKRNK